ncbi:MAG: hypothetical protein DMG42_16995 [Acidobacteria bacterium]|nr:MAG: hypothetical protein DMG42_16995 [Acidobacteriota bacterium]
MRYSQPLRFPARTKSIEFAVRPNPGCPASGPHRHNERARVELVFHSLAAATPGVRSAAHCQRHLLLYRAEPYELDVRLEWHPARNRLVVTGQLLNSSQPEIFRRDDALNRKKSPTDI